MAVSAAANEGRILIRSDVNGRAGFNTPCTGPVPLLRNKGATSRLHNCCSSARVMNAKTIQYSLVKAVSQDD